MGQVHTSTGWKAFRNCSPVISASVSILYVASNTDNVPPAQIAPKCVSLVMEASRTLESFIRPLQQPCFISLCESAMQIRASWAPTVKNITRWLDAAASPVVSLRAPWAICKSNRPTAAPIHPLNPIITLSFPGRLAWPSWPFDAILLKLGPLMLHPAGTDVLVQ